MNTLDLFTLLDALDRCPTPDVVAAVRAEAERLAELHADAGDWLVASYVLRLSLRVIFCSFLGEWLVRRLHLLDGFCVQPSGSTTHFTSDAAGRLLRCRDKRDTRALDDAARADCRFDARDALVQHAAGGASASGAPANAAIWHYDHDATGQNSRRSILFHLLAPGGK